MWPIAKRDQGRVLECMLTRFMTRAAKGWQSLQFDKPFVAQVPGQVKNSFARGIWAPEKWGLESGLLIVPVRGL